MHTDNTIVERFPDNRSSGATTLRQCQLVMARMLKILDFICAKHEISYWMTAGTLIGAIRHKGFIPWDCDIDVGITRKDLEHLKQVRHEFPADMFYQDGETDSHYPKHSLVTKLRDRYSNYFEWQQNNPGAKWHNGLQVDLFIYETDDNGLLINPFKGTRYQKEDIFPVHDYSLRVPTCVHQTSMMTISGGDTETISSCLIRRIVLPMKEKQTRFRPVNTRRVCNLKTDNATIRLQATRVSAE